MREKVFVVTVTYGDRFYLLKQVIEACLSEGVDKVIVVDNNSIENSKQQLKALTKTEGRLKVIYLDENRGSAGGYKKGLEEAYNNPNCDYIWLLDDDNVPLRGALESLLLCWKKINLNNKEKKTALLSWRKNKEFLQVISIIKRDLTLILGKENSFLGFHLIQFPNKIVRLIKRISSRDDINLDKYLTYLHNNNIEYGVIPVAPYGGLFMHKSMIENIGYPNDSFFTYADDHEWTYRITKLGGKIYLCWKSQIEDIEMSWHMKNKRLSGFNTFLMDGSDLRVYYSVRNRVYFESKNLVSNVIIYNLNKHVFLFILRLLSLILSKRKRFKFIKKAIKDGLNSKLGIISIRGSEK